MPIGPAIDLNRKSEQLKFAKGFVCGIDTVYLGYIVLSFIKVKRMMNYSDTPFFETATVIDDTFLLTSDAFNA